MSLTDRERENLQYLADGKRMLDVATIRGVWYEHIKREMVTIRRKLDAETTEHALAIAMRQGIIS